jgi:endonuclease V-like protein UPF0215 family
MTTKTIVVLAALGALTGCATSALEEDYGNSVASLIQAQTANPATLTSPSAVPVTGVDPDYANNVVTEFRKDVSKPEKVREPIEMAVISSSGGGW